MFSLLLDRNFRSRQDFYFRILTRSIVHQLRQSLAWSIVFDSSWGLVWVPHCKPIPAWQKCLLKCCPGSSPSSISSDQLNLLPN
jgi:hypothetical protein